MWNDAAAMRSFEEGVQERVRFLAFDCYPGNVGFYLGKLNTHIEGGIDLGAKGLRKLSREEITALRQAIVPRRKLNQSATNQEIYDNLVQALTEAGINPVIFEKKGVANA